MKLRAAEPAGYERGPAFVTRARGCGLEDVRTPVYEKGSNAAALRLLRTHAKLGLRDAASALGISAVELSGLERGRLVPEDKNDWLKMLETMAHRRSE